MTTLSIVSRKVKFTSEGGSFYFMTRAEIQRQVKSLESKENLTASSKETLRNLKSALDFALENGL